MSAGHGSRVRTPSDGMPRLQRKRAVKPSWTVRTARTGPRRHAGSHDAAARRRSGRAAGHGLLLRAPASDLALDERGAEEDEPVSAASTRRSYGRCRMNGCRAATASPFTEPTRSSLDWAATIRSSVSNVSRYASQKSAYTRSSPSSSRAEMSGPRSRGAFGGCDGASRTYVSIRSRVATETASATPSRIIPRQ